MSRFIFGNSFNIVSMFIFGNSGASSYAHILTSRFPIPKVICTCFVQLSTSVGKHELSRLI